MSLDRKLLRWARKPVTFSDAILGLTGFSTNDGREGLVAAHYSHPGFEVFEVGASSNKLGLRPKGYISLAQNAKEQDAVIRFPLWNADEYTHHPPRAQQAQVLGTNNLGGITDLAYLQNGDTTIKRMNPQTNEALPAVTGFKNRIEAFHFDGNGSIFTIETPSLMGAQNPALPRKDIAWYRATADEKAPVYETARSSGRQFADARPESSVMGYGIFRHHDELFFLLDERSKAINKGIYRIQLGDSPAFRNAGIVEGSEGLTGNGLAFTKQGVFISHYHPIRESRTNPEPSISFIPWAN